MGGSIGKPQDTVVVGASLEAVAAACLLARAGQSVLLLDPAATLGGAFQPRGFTDAQGRSFGAASSIAPIGPGTLPADLIRLLELERHGLQVDPAPGPALVTRSGVAARLERDAFSTVRLLDGLRPGEGARFQRLRGELGRLRRIIGPALRQQPLDPAAIRAKTGSLVADLAHFLGAQGGEPAEQLLNLASTSCADRLRHDLQSAVLRALIAADALAHQGAGPLCPGSALALLGPEWLTPSAGPSAPLDFGVVPRGGAGALSEALVKALGAAGVTLGLEAEVARILVADGRVRGVALLNGTEIEAERVISGFDVKSTLLSLIDWKVVPSDLMTALRGHGDEGRVARIAVSLGTLDFLPDTLLEGDFGSVHMAESITAMDSARDEALDLRTPSIPWLTLHLDAAQEGAGALMTLSAHYVPARFQEGDWTAQKRESFREAVLRLVNDLWPGFLDAVEGASLWLPSDMEQGFGHSGGYLGWTDWAPDRLYWNRPSADVARHLGAIDGLSFCGPDMAGLPGKVGYGGMALARALRKRPVRKRRMMGVWK